MMRQEIDVFPAVTQWRNVNLDSIQAKQQVLAEPACDGLGIHVGVRRREHSHDHAASCGGADTLEVSCFQNTQQFCLQVKRNVCNFVQKQRAAVRESEPSDAVGPRIRKCAFHMAEELALEHALGERSEEHTSELQSHSDLVCRLL